MTRGLELIFPHILNLARVFYEEKHILRSIVITIGISAILAGCSQAMYKVVVRDPESAQVYYNVFSKRFGSLEECQRSLDGSEKELRSSLPSSLGESGGLSCVKVVSVPKGGGSNDYVREAFAHRNDSVGRTLQRLGQ